MSRITGPRDFYGFTKISNRRNVRRSMQVLAILLAMSPSIATSGRLDSTSSTFQHPSASSRTHEDAIFINFPKKQNSTKIARQIYLPSGQQNFFLPEVIDNRSRGSSSVFRPAQSLTGYPSFSPSPEVDLRGSSENDDKRFRSRQNLGRVKVTGDELPVAYTTKDHLTSGVVQINSMACQNGADELFFRASMRSSRLTDHPTIEGAIGDNCKIDRTNDDYIINLANEFFWNCGVRDCSDDKDRYYCLNVRFPAINGLRLKEDVKVTLRCKTQEKTVSHTRRLNVKTLDTSGRNAPRVETGGHRNAFETEVGLYRKTFGSGHLFDAKIEPGGTVVLGEEILLRALVRDGDGWRYSRISDVTVHYVEKKRRSKIMNSLWILDANGCLNPEVREICSREQYRVSPLENYLTFEAFMFDNMKETDEMVMNVRITGCLDGADCAINCPAGHSRRSRSVQDIGHNQTIDWSDDITFRVISNSEFEPSTSEKFVDHRLALPYILSVIVLVAIVALIATINAFRKHRVTKN